MLIDTHCHIHDSDYAISADDVLAHAKACGVQKMITIGTTPANSQEAREFAKQHEPVWWTFGYHPSEYDGDAQRLEAELTAAKAELADNKLIGIGEIGLDYHTEPFSRTQQITLLEHMLQLAQDYRLPVSFHVRDAFDDFWPILDNFHLVPSVMHSFSDNEQNLAESLARGFYVGVNGLSTFATIPHPPLSRAVFETDAPYLTPKPFRGKINEPSHVRNIAEWAAQYYQVDYAEVQNITTQNAQTVYKI